MDLGYEQNLVERGVQTFRLFLGKHVRLAPLKNGPNWVVPKLKYHTPFWVKYCGKYHLAPFYLRFFWKVSIPFLSEGLWKHLFNTFYLNVFETYALFNILSDTNTLTEWPDSNTECSTGGQ